MTDDLVAWLRAQLDEDGRRSPLRGTCQQCYVWETEGCGGIGDECLRSRTMREVEAKRRIIDRCDHYLTYEDYGLQLAAEVLKLLAVPYAERPGWDERWRP